MAELEVLRRAPYGDHPNVGARARRTHDRLLNTALRVFERKGHRDTTIDDIARTARTSRATIYQYFESKTEILVALSSRMAAELLDVAKQLPEIDEGPEGLEALRQWLGQLLDVMFRYGPVLDAWADPTSGMDALAEASEALMRRFDRNVGKRLAGHRPELDPAIVAKAVFSMVDGLTMRLLHGDIDLDREELVATLAGIMHAGLFAAPARSARRGR